MEACERKDAVTLTSGPNSWVCFPSAKIDRCEEALKNWHAKGYKSCVFIDRGAPKPKADYVMEGDFPGYYRVIGELCDEAFIRGADVVTCIGDDMTPDPYATARDIAEEYLQKYPDGEGVMQACGDMQGFDAAGVQAAARICGSPTFGKSWITRAYGGNGPFWTGYHSYYGDEDIWNVAKNAGLLWLEPRFTFLHQHWSFGWMEQTGYQKRNSDQHWHADRTLFYERKEAGFPHSAMVPR